MYFNDPEDKFQILDSLSFLEPLNTFFAIKQRGGAENSGGSKTIFPDFSQSPYPGILNSNRGYGIKNSKRARKLILEKADLEEEPAIHFPSPYD